jgi:CRISPR-associated protein Csm1
MNGMQKEVVWLAALLHDLGKFWQRSYPGRTLPHEEYSRRFVEERFQGYFHPCGGDLAHAIAHHHRWPRVQRDSEKLVILADWLSAHEREKEDRAQEAPSHAALVALLSRPPIAPDGTPELRWPLGQLDWKDEAAFFPSQGATATPESYRELWQAFEAEMAQLAGKRGYHTADFVTLLALLRKYTSRLPAATPWEGDGQRTVPDISLYDHLRTTAAIAACLQEELGSDELDQALSALASRRLGDPILQRPLAALVKGDVSGTQDFLFLLTAKGAARGLRGRSFYLQLLTETVARWILRQLELPPSNLLMVAGGHFYLLLPFRKTTTAIENWRRQVAEKLWRIHHGDLFLTVDYVPVAASDFLEGSTGGHAFATKWDEVSAQVNQRKQRKARDLADEDFFRYLFEPQERGGVERTCDVCRHEGDLSVEDDVAKCARCRGFEELGRQLREAGYLLLCEIGDETAPPVATYQQALRTFGMDVWLCEELQELAQKTFPASASSITVSRLDSTDLLPDLPASWYGLRVNFDFRCLADATPRKPTGEIAEFSELVEAARGAKWLGVLRMDVDSLGELFRSRLGPQGTISRMGTVSEGLRLFFEGWVPHLCRRRNGGPTDTASVFLTYAGGDDLFLVGAWSVLPELACEIRSAFGNFVGGGHVTLSGGIAIEHSKYPLYQLAEDAKRALDDKAKEHRRSVGGREVRKDALCFLQTPIGWERFQEIRDWQERLVDMIERPSDGQPALPHGFLTRLEEIHELYRGNAARRRRFHRLGQIKTENELREMIRFDKWQWQLVYQLGRFGQSYPHLKPDILQLQQAIAREQDGLVAVLNVLARWVALLTR